jgi:hypothetical protein
VVTDNSTVADVNVIAYATAFTNASRGQCPTHESSEQPPLGAEASCPCADLGEVYPPLPVFIPLTTHTIAYVDSLNISVSAYVVSN